MSYKDDQRFAGGEKKRQSLPRFAHSQLFKKKLDPQYKTTVQPLSKFICSTYK
jgi:hypothetical protein